MSGFVKARGFEDAVTWTGEQEGGGSDHEPGYLLFQVQYVVP